MHIKDIVNYVKNEINFSREFCEDNVFVTLRIEPVERIIENLEQKDKDNLSYAEDLAKVEAKANKYDGLVEKIKEKTEELENKINKCKHHKHTVIEANIVKYELQKLLDTEK